MNTNIIQEYLYIIMYILSEICIFMYKVYIIFMYKASNFLNEFK